MVLAIAIIGIVFALMAIVALSVYINGGGEDASWRNTFIFTFVMTEFALIALYNLI